MENDKPFSDIKRIIILGNNGFIGNHLIRFFQKHLYEIEIIGYSMPELDLTDPRRVSNLGDIFDSKTTVIMCSGIKKQLGDSLEIFNKNIKMVENICSILLKRPVQRFVFFSSADVYGDNNHADIDESTPVNPASYYGIAKYTSELLLQRVINFDAGNSLLILRPPLVYGYGDMSRGYGPSGFVWAAINKKEIKLWGDGTEFREFIFIEDIVKIVYRLIMLNYNGVLNVVSGKSYTFKEILDTLSNLIPAGLKIHSYPRTKQKIDNRFCNKKIIQLLPDIIFTGLEEGIKCTYEVEYKMMMESKQGL